MLRGRLELENTVLRGRLAELEGAVKELQSICSRLSGLPTAMSEYAEELLTSTGASRRVAVPYSSEKRKTTRAFKLSHEGGVDIWWPRKLAVKHTGSGTKYIVVPLWLWEERLGEGVCSAAVGRAHT